MAWDPLGTDEYSGDLPMDAFGCALDDIATAWSQATGELPSTADLVRAFRAALDRAPTTAVTGRDQLDQLLAPRKPRSRKQRPPRLRAKVGDLLRIPYGDGRAVYGRVLAEGSRQPGVPETPLVAVLDREVVAGDDLADVPGSPWLLVPVNSGDHEWGAAGWEVLGNLPLRGPELLLPCFEVSRGIERATGRLRLQLFDYHGTPIDETPAHRRRVIPGGSSAGPAWIANAVMLVRRGQPIGERDSVDGRLVALAEAW